MQDFDQFQMPPALVQQLYNNSVYTLDKIDEKSALPVPTPESFYAIGSARNRLAVLVKQDSSLAGGAGLPETLPEPSYLFLASILKACNLEIGDTLILLLGEGYSKEEIHSILQAQGVCQVLMFGVAPVDLGLPALFPAFQPQQLAGMKFMWAHPLAKLEDKESKKNLWAALKQYFGI
jgi:hypothetical protein